MMIRLIWVVVLCGIRISTNQLSAQGNHRPIMNDLSWSAQSNPAVFISGSDDSSAWRIDLPSIYLAGQSNIGLGDYLQPSSDGLSIVTSILLPLAEDLNRAHFSGHVQSFALALRRPKWQIELAHSIHAQSYLSYTDELLDVLVNGNAPYIGTRVDLDFKVSAQTYHDISLGFAYQINDKFNAGLRAHYVLGIQNILSEQGIVSLFTNPEFYQLSFNNAILINTSNALDFNSLSDISFSNTPTDYWQISTANSGLLLDIGLSYEVNDKIIVGLSIDNVGTIDWTKSTEQLRSDGPYVYDGVDAFPQLLNDQGLGLSDSLAQILRINTQEGVNYSSHVPSNIQLDAKYRLDKSTDLLLHYRFTDYYHGDQSTFGLAAYRDLAKLFRLGLSGMYSDQHSLLIGIDARLRLGRFEISAIGDNVLFMFNDRFANLWLRMGLQF